MNSVVSLALPFFGLILLGYACGRRLRYPEAGLQWMSFFIVYLALPALFFKLIAEAPFEQLNNWPFVIGTTLSTFAIFVLSFLVGMIALRGQVREGYSRIAATVARRLPPGNHATRSLGRSRDRGPWKPAAKNPPGQEDSSGQVAAVGWVERVPRGRGLTSCSRLGDRPDERANRRRGPRGPLCRRRPSAGNRGRRGGR